MVRPGRATKAELKISNEIPAGGVGAVLLFQVLYGIFFFFFFFFFF